MRLSRKEINLYSAESVQTPKRNKEYTNLSGGDYEFRVVSRNLYGNESTEATYKFSVEHPWYLRWRAFLIYLIAATTLSQQEDKTNDDGMDVCLCLLEKTETNTHKVTYAGAMRDLYYISPNEQLETIKGDHKLIGGGRKQLNKEFSNKTIELDNGSLLYLTSDGFIDQHNSERKKFGSLQLKALLEELSDKPLAEQKTHLDRVFTDHKGEMHQRDDVTILGVKLS